ncbi:MAG: hydrolase [Sphingomonas sp.]|nr:MAG: hydrolase [Sphingomonas sp.]
MSRTSLLAALTMGIAAAPLAAATQPVDLLFVNGHVLTVDKSFSTVSAVAVKDGRIVATGGAELAGRYSAARRIDLGGRTLMPGFIDTHLHLYGLSHRAIEPAKATSIADLKAMVAAKAKALGPGEWIIGYGWDEAQLADHRVPTRADLDAAAPDNPVALTRAGAHSIVANSLAFQKAGITAKTPDPESGLIEHGPNGEPSGIIRERTDLITSLVPNDTPDQMRPSYIASLKALLALGITSFMEAFTSIDDEPVGKGGKEAGEETRPGPSLHSWREFRSIYDEMGADLPRITLYIAYPGAKRLREFPYHTGYGNDRIKLGPIGETPYDGGFTGPTALTKEDYKGLPGFRGKAFMTREKALELVQVSAERGWQLGIHAIGDAAIETMAGVYHDVLVTRPKSDHRWFLSHFTMQPSDATMDQMVKDGVYAAAQPNFLYNLEGRYEATLDGARLENINPVGVPLRHNVKMAFGSDNLPIGPMVGLYAAISRKGPDGREFGPEQKVSRQEAIRLYTADAAKLSFDEAKKGSIETGKLADLIVLDHDPLTVPENQILNINVDMTFVGGKEVYRRLGNP